MGYGNIGFKNSDIFSPLQMVYVAKNGNDITGNGFSSNPFLTVQRAINSITDASNSKKYVIEIKTGEYAESLSFKPYVELKGESKETAKITGTHIGTFNTGGRLEIRDITIRGSITFDKPAGVVNGVSVWISNIWADSITVNFRGTNDYFQMTDDCLINGNLIHHSSHVLFKDSLIYGNITTDDQGVEVLDPSYGDSGTRNISTSGCNNVTVIGNCWLELHNCHTWGSLTANGAASYLNYDVVSAPENPASVISLNSGNISLMSHASALANDSSVEGASVKDALNNLSTSIRILSEFYTDSGSIDATETDLYSYSIPSNTIINNGDKIQAKFCGNCYGSLSTKQIKVYFGGNLIFDTTALNVLVSILR